MGVGEGVGLGLGVGAGFTVPLRVTAAVVLPLCKATLPETGPIGAFGAIRTLMTPPLAGRVRELPKPSPLLGATWKLVGAVTRIFWLIEMDLTVKDFDLLGVGEVAVNLDKLVGEGMRAADLAGLTVPCTATD